MEKNWVIRLINPANDLKIGEQINSLLKAANRSQNAFAASYESADATLRRIREGECYAVFSAEQLVGCIILRTHSKKGAPVWYDKPGVASFGRFAIRPDLQNQGIGSLLLDFIEQRAKALGCSELALDTSEHAERLIQMYEKRGYRIVGHHQWRATSFRSLVLSKAI